MRRGGGGDEERTRGEKIGKDRRGKRRREEK